MKQQILFLFLPALLIFMSKSLFAVAEQRTDFEKSITKHLVRNINGQIKELKEADLGANAPNYDYSLFLIFPVEVLASALLMAVIFTVVYTKGLKGFSGIAIGGIVGLDIFFLAFISGASMNPARALAPAVLSGVLENLWLYWTAPYVGTIIVAFLFRGKFAKQRIRENS